MANWTVVFELQLLLLIVLLVQFSEGSKSSFFNKFRSSNDPQGSSTTWAVLVAGSNGFENYRHQADVCHAYQILKRGGLKDENIIVFMYDDIADHPENPWLGHLINSPNEIDVYEGVPKDYTGESVNVFNFFAVLLGDATELEGGSGKVVASKPSDKIFLYYSAHGDVGTLGMLDDVIYANNFLQMLELMHKNGRYDEMVIYLESCHSGSMFDGKLPPYLNIYATTASNPTQNSYATYCPGTNTPPPPDFTTCLGDLYSVSWMEDSDTADLGPETLKQQYMTVKDRTINIDDRQRGSEVMQYGNLDISDESISVYQGSTVRASSVGPIPSHGSMGLIDQREADLYAMWYKYNTSKQTLQQKKKLLKEIKEITAHRAYLDNSVKKISGYLLPNGHGPARAKGSPVVDDWECLRSMVEAFKKYCGPLPQNCMNYGGTFANICNNGVTKKARDYATQMACSESRP